MRNIADGPETTPTAPTTPTKPEQYKQPERKIFSTKLTNGREIFALEMTGNLLIMMESKLKKEPSFMRKAFYMLSNHLLTKENPLSVSEMESYPARDVVALIKLFSLTAGQGEEDEEEKEDEEEEFDIYGPN
jgi:hypothetical protein